MDELERKLECHINALREEGESKDLSGFGHPLRTCQVSRGAWRLVLVWQKVQVPARALALTVLMAGALGNNFKLQGDVRLAVGILLVFLCSIRTPGRGCTGVLALPVTKGSQRRGCQEMVTHDVVSGCMCAIV